MSLRALEAQGRIEGTRAGPGQVKGSLDRAKRDLTTAKANLKIDEEWAFAIAYHAMLRAGRALMFSMGFRPKGRDQHKTVVEFCSTVLGEDFEDLSTRFNRMRVKRHDFIYDPERPIPRSETEKSLESAGKFVQEIEERIRKMSRQSDLF